MAQKTQGAANKQMQMWRENDKLEEEKEKWSAQSSRPHSQYVSSKHDNRSRHKNRKTGWNQTKVSPTTTTAAITSHYNPPIKSFTACLGGESAAGMIHHCSVSQITDRPSPPHCSSESLINWPDTSNDSLWKSRCGSQTQTHMHNQDECHKQSDRSRWWRRPIRLLIGVVVSAGWIVSFRPSALSEEVITTREAGNMWNRRPSYWLMCFPLTPDWVEL